METKSSQCDLGMLLTVWDLTLEIVTSGTCFLWHGTQLRVGGTTWVSYLWNNTSCFRGFLCIFMGPRLRGKSAPQF